MSKIPQVAASHPVIVPSINLALDVQNHPQRGDSFTPNISTGVPLAYECKLQEICQSYRQRLLDAITAGGPAVPLFKGYGLKARSKPRNLKPGNLALPKQGNMAVDFLPRLPRSLQHIFADEEKLFSKPPPPKRRKAAWKVLDADYGSVMQELQSRGMVEFTQTPPLVTNGAFGVPKKEDWNPLSRVITDATPLNELTIDLPPTKLPNPSSLRLLPSWVKFGAAGDLESYYNNLKLPVPWRKYFGFPPLRGRDIGKSDNDWYFPQSATVPMGWKGSVLIAQTFHEELFAEFLNERAEESGDLLYVNLDDAEAVRLSYQVDPSEVIYYLIYIDDVTFFGLNKKIVNSELRKLFAFYAKEGFTVKSSKTTWATSELRVLGVWMDLINKEILPMADKLLFLHTCLPRVANSKRAITRREMQSLIGLMLWNMLLFRPSLSILDACFAFTQELVKRGPLVLWPSVRSELRAVWGLLPMIKSKMGALLRPGAIASDATGSDSSGTVGLGVAYCLNFPQDVFVQQMWSANFIDHINPPESAWKWAVATTRTSTQPVHVQEMLGFLLGLRVAKRHGFRGDKGPVLLFNDNQGVVGAVAKGRSKSKPLNCLLRHYCAWTLENDWYIPYVPYIPTKLNPSDAPSRYFKRRPNG